jgi:phosphoribosylformimino-5-aminoimidazole carboxamide ribotide isomerase
MIIVPAIDIREGKCVRLVRGDPKRETVYSDDPAEIAKRWMEQGATRIHVVDLDAAMGRGNNLEALKRIKESVNIMIQFGGGLRTLDAVWNVIGMGVSRVVVGTALLKDPGWIKEAMEELGTRVMAAVDAKDGEVMIGGWLDGSGIKVAEALKRIEDLGLKEIIYTDIKRDGMLEGPNVDGLRQVLKLTKMSVYASGGISSLLDIKALRELEKEGLKGAVVGKALYDRRFSLSEALDVEGF